MGLDFIRDQKELFVQTREKRRDSELEGEDLLSRIQNENVQCFRCRLYDPDCQFEPGIRMVLRAYSETQVEISQSSKVIGTMDLDQALLLANLMKTNKTHTGILTVLPMGKADIEGCFMVKPKKPFKTK